MAIISPVIVEPATIDAKPLSKLALLAQSRAAARSIVVPPVPVAVVLSADPPIAPLLDKPLSKLQQRIKDAAVRKADEARAKTGGTPQAVVTPVAVLVTPTIVAAAIVIPSDEQPPAWIVSPPLPKASIRSRPSAFGAIIVTPSPIRSSQPQTSSSLPNTSFNTFTTASSAAFDGPSPDDIVIAAREGTALAGLADGKRKAEEERLKREIERR